MGSEAFMLEPVKQLPGSLAPAQCARLARFASARCVDMHCHCLPGVDDGPATLADALWLCRSLVADGITTAIATPHQLGRYDGQNHPSAIREKIALLRDALANAGIPLELHAGGDVRIDERLPALLDNDCILTLADGNRHLLLELPHDIFVDIRQLIAALVVQGITPVISHPERHRWLQRQPQAIPAWLAAGAAVQITAGSIVGDFGEEAARSSWEFLRQGWVSLVATDAHSQSRPPRMSAAIDAIANRLCHAVARRICIENPLRVLEGRELIQARQSAVAGVATGVATGTITGGGRS